MTVDGRIVEHHKFLIDPTCVPLMITTLHNYFTSNRRLLGRRGIEVQQWVLVQVGADLATTLGVSRRQAQRSLPIHNVLLESLRR